MHCRIFIMTWKTSLIRSALLFGAQKLEDHRFCSCILCGSMMRHTLNLLDIATVPYTSGRWIGSCQQWREEKYSQSFRIADGLTRWALQPTRYAFRKSETVICWKSCSCESNSIAGSGRSAGAVWQGAAGALVPVGIETVPVRQSTHRGWCTHVRASVHHNHNDAALHGSEERDSQLYQPSGFRHSARVRVLQDIDAIGCTSLQTLSRKCIGGHAECGHRSMLVHNVVFRLRRLALCLHWLDWYSGQESRQLQTRSVHYRFFVEDVAGSRLFINLDHSLR